MTYLKWEGIVLNWEHVSAIFVEEDKFGQFEEKWQVKARLGSSPVIQVMAKCRSESAARAVLAKIVGKALGREAKQRGYDVV